LRLKEDVYAAVIKACGAIDDKFGKDIVVLDISEISPLADYFIIVTGMNPVQTRTMAEACEVSCAASGFPLANSEGAGTGWFLMDFTDIVVHIFNKEMREFYNLERIWADAANVRIDLSPAKDASNKPSHAEG